MAFLAGAVIPMLGGEFAKAQKKPNLKMDHGLYECFYDENGDLTLYQQDEENKAGQECTEGSCGT